MPLPPSSSPLFADTACANPEATNQVGESVSLNGRALDIERPVVEDAGSSSPHEKKAEYGSPLYDDPDIEMEGSC